jgi:hypothetical protein
MNRWLALSVVFALCSVSGVVAAVPGPPQNLTATVTGNTVALNWVAPSVTGAPASYLLEAALSPAGVPIASLPVPTNSLVVPNVPNGVYYVAVRAVNADGVSGPSNEVILVVPGGGGGCASPPGPPVNLTGAVFGTTVSLNWFPPVGGCDATSYAVQAGSASTLSNIAVVNVGSATGLAANAPNGVYYIRVIGLNGFGGSVPSNEIVRAVGPASPTFNGTYTGRSDSGDDAGDNPLAFTVTNGVVIFTMGTDPVDVVTGTVSGIGALAASGGFCNGTLTGQITVTASGVATASGTWSHPTSVDCGPANAGTWTATR